MKESSHGSDKNSFRESYIEASQNSRTFIHHLDDAKRLRFGFVESVKNGFKEDGGWYQVWHTVRIQAWRDGDKRDSSYVYNFHQSVLNDIEALERIERKRMDTYTPLYVSGRNNESYFYLGDGVILFVPEYNKAREEWYEADDDKTFYEFLEEIKDKSWQTQKKLD